MGCLDMDSPCCRIQTEYSGLLARMVKVNLVVGLLIMFSDVWILIANNKSFHRNHLF